MSQMLYTGYKCGKPAAVRYPRGNAIGVELTPLAELENWSFKNGSSR